MLKHSVLALLCLFATLGAAAQTLSKNTTTITGTVQNTDGAPVDYVNAAILLLPDSLAIDGTTCLDGKLQIETKATGEALLRLSVVGYADKFVPLTLQGGENNLGTITMQANTTLSAVTVTAHRPTIVSKADRTIVNVEGSILSSALDGEEMLQKTPGLQKDPTSGDITVFGKGTPVIYIDDKEVHSSDEVKMLNPQNIKSIEIIDNPPAAYDAQGAAVVLIHTTKSEDAYSVRVGGSYTQGRRASGNGYMEGHLSEGKFSGDLHYGYSDANMHNSTNTHYTPDNLHTIHTDYDQPISQQSHNAYLSLAYTPAKNHTIGLQGNGNYYNIKTPMTNYTYSDLPDAQAFHTYADTQYPTWWQAGGTLFYNWQIDTLGQSFKFVADATKLSKKETSPYYNVLDSAPAGEAPFMNETDNNGANVLYSLRADYVKPIGKVWQIETGAKYYRINSDTRTVQTGSTDLNQTYKSREWNMAGYISVSTKVSDKVDLRYGLRAEYNNRRGWDNERKYVDRSTMDWFPSFLLNYTPSDKFNMGFSYTKRVNRPAVQMLDPSLMTTDSLFTRAGNPDLQSEKIHVFQLTLGICKDFNIRASYSYLINQTAFNCALDAQNPNAIHVYYNNIRHANSYTVSATYTKDIFKWWSATFYAGIWGSEYRYTDTDGIRKNNNKPQWSLSTDNTFSLPWNLMLDVGFYWDSASGSNSLYLGAYSNFYATLRRDFLDGALSVRLSANDMFNNSQPYQRSVLPGKSWTANDLNTRYISLSVSYKFGKSKHQYQSMSGSAEEQGRL